MFKSLMLKVGGWCVVGALILLYTIITLVAAAVGAAFIVAYLWCLWNFPALTIAVGVCFLGLVFLITNTTLFDGIFKGCI